MNKNIGNLHAIAGKRQRQIIGLMSGTSLDGLDIALCAIEGSGTETKLRLRQFITVPYDNDFKTEVQNVFSKEQVNLQKLCLLNEWIAIQHAIMINDCLELWNIPSTEIDLIASHGQTIYHAPLSLHGLQKFGNGTLQIGDGDHLAVNTGIITISDFRQKHVAAGGEGAPLAAYGDYLLFKEAGEDVVLLNIGGIANFTFLPANEMDGRMFSSDTGPGNGLMDAWMQKSFPGEFYDKDAKVAAGGLVNEPLLKCLLHDNFFTNPLPKTTGPELFNLNYLDKAINTSGATKISIQDVMATLNRLTAQSIIDALQPVLSEVKCTIYVSGGGMHNPLLMDFLKQGLPGVNIESTATKGIDPDAKEAILFAVLANECIAGDTSVFKNATDKFPAISMGKISFPL